MGCVDANSKKCRCSYIQACIQTGVRVLMRIPGRTDCQLDSKHRHIAKRVESVQRPLNFIHIHTYTYVHMYCFQMADLEKSEAPQPSASMKWCQSRWSLTEYRAHIHIHTHTDTDPTTTRWCTLLLLLLP